MAINTRAISTHAAAHIAVTPELLIHKVINCRGWLCHGYGRHINQVYIEGQISESIK